LGDFYNLLARVYKVRLCSWGSAFGLELATIKRGFLLNCLSVPHLNLRFPQLLHVGKPEQAG
jgi:hypothetical protein